MGNPTEPTGAASVFATLREAQGAMREHGDRRYHYAISCLLPPLGHDHWPDDEIAPILRELDAVDPEEYTLTLTLADLRAARPLRECAWHIPALDWVSSSTATCRLRTPRHETGVPVAAFRRRVALGLAQAVHSGQSRQHREWKVQHAKDDKQKLARLEAAAWKASGMLRMALRRHAEGRATTEDLLATITGAAYLLEQAQPAQHDPLGE